jgi:hypothetical protein
VKQALIGPLWLQRLFPFHCFDCGSESGFRSRPRTFSERYFLPIFLLQPVRCAECFRRDYRVIFTPVKERAQEAMHRIGAAEPRTRSNVA